MEHKLGMMILAIFYKNEPICRRYARWKKYRYEMEFPENEDKAVAANGEKKGYVSHI